LDVAGPAVGVADGLASPAPQHPGRARVLAVLCVTQVTSWGILYYAFPVLSADLITDTGWSRSAVTAAFSLALVISGVTGIAAGRILDRSGPRWVMSGGSIIGVVAVAAIAGAQTLPQFYAAWVLAGIAMAGTLYAPAFAALTRWYGPDRVRALTVLTLAGGLASTVFAPITAVLIGHMDWRQTYLVLAVVLAVVTIPLHVFGLSRPWPARPALGEGRHVAAERGEADPGRTARSRPFLLLMVSMTLAAFSFYAVIVNVVPLLEERGLSTGTAAWALGLGGAGQVAGRLGYAALVARTSVRSRTVMILLAGAATTSLLGLLPGPILVLVAASVLAGAVRGIYTLLQATAVADRWGTTHYGRLNGLLSAPMMVAAAVAPAAGAALADALGGYAELFQLLAAVGVAAALVSLPSAPLTRERAVRPG
jgi:MFS family permease